MTKKAKLLTGISLGAALTIIAIVALPRIGDASSPKKKVVEIRMKGSDTMIQLATAWAEACGSVTEAASLDDSDESANPLDIDHGPTVPRGAKGRFTAPEGTAPRRPSSRLVAA